MKHHLLLAAASGALALSVPLAAQNRTFTNQYTFGDSLSDSGNIFAATSALGVPTPLPPYFQGRLSNGPVFTERLGQTLALVATTPPTVRSSLNFAFGGANAGGAAALPASLGVQVGLFRQRGITPTRDDLFTVLAGPNDLVTTLAAPTTPGNPAVLDGAGAAAAQAVAVNVQALIGLGAKNLVVLGVPNLGATPRALALGGPGGAGAALGLRGTNAFNAELRNRLGAIAASPLAADVNLVYTDLQGVLDTIVTRYREFGFANASSYYLAPAAAGGGVGDPNSYVFWDDIHPTARTHELLAGVVTEQLNPERPLGFSAALGSATLALQGLTTRALDARVNELAASRRPTGRADVYAAFNYGDGGRGRDRARPKFKYAAQVMTAGVDRHAANGFFYGGALNLGRLNADVTAGGGEFTVEDAGGRIYAAWGDGPVSLLLDANYGTLTVKDIERTTGFGGLKTRAKSGGDHWGAGIKAVWTVEQGANRFLPWVGLRTERVRLDGYTETAVPVLALAYDDQEAKSSSAALGLDFSRVAKWAGRSLRWDLRGVWHGEIGSRTRQVAGRLADNFTRATTLAVEDGDGEGVELGGAATLFFRGTWSASLGYAADLRSGDRIAHRATLSVQSGF